MSIFEKRVDKIIMDLKKKTYELQQAQVSDNGEPEEIDEEEQKALEEVKRLEEEAKA